MSKSLQNDKNLLFIGKTGQRIEAIDYFRGIAIIGVVVYHLISQYMSSLPTIFKYGANLGSSGVLVFFLCSGFSLYYSQQRHPKSWLVFIKKKIVTIYLPYIFVVFVTALFASTLFPEVKSIFIAVLSHVFQFRIFSKQYFQSFGGHWWYLGTLFEFFICFYPLKKLMDKVGNHAFLAFCIIISVAYVILLALLGQDNNVVLIRFFPKYMIEFGFGMIIAKELLSERLKIKVNHSILLGVGAIGIIILGLSGGSPIGRLLNDIPSFIGVTSLLFWSYLVMPKTLIKFGLILSKISFELYLTHILVFSCVFSFSNGTVLSDGLCAVFAVSIALVVAYCYHRVIVRLKSIYYRK